MHRHPRCAWLGQLSALVTPSTFRNNHMPRCQDPLLCIVPPYMLERMADSKNATVRKLAINSIARSAALRATRTALAPYAATTVIASPTAALNRLVYDNQTLGQSALPGKIVRQEGGPATGDTAVNEAYDYSGATYDYFKTIHGRNSLDDAGMTLVSSVHVGVNYQNAFWNGTQMAYGDGDGSVFLRFTKALDVVAHELSHGVVSHTCALEYRDEPGALNEHFADVFGTLVKQYTLKQTVKAADWLIGHDLMGPGTTARAIRSFDAGPAYQHDPVLGTDPQPKHYSKLYTGSADNGGVHINSGIPNHAFYLVAHALGGRAWLKAGRIWYDTMRALHKTSDFKAMVAMSTQCAGALYGANSPEENAVAQAWKAVGL
jgi:Zn-dependent metalloprotease